MYCGERIWPILLASCLVFPALLGLALALGRGLLAIWERWHNRRYRLVPGGLHGHARANVRPSWMSTVKFAVGEFISSTTFTGRALALLDFCLGMTVLVIYFTHVSSKITGVESCVVWTDRTDLQIEFACNIILLSIFLLRFIGAVDKVEFLLSVYALVTYLTIPPSFLTIALNHDWIGLRCLRACHLLTIPRSLRRSHLNRKAIVLRLIHICTVVVTVLLVAAGIFHLLDATGNDWEIPDTDKELPGRQIRPYWEWVYMAVITLSTVGYGDIYPQSALGRIFSVIFIVAALALFASSVPEMAAIISSWHNFEAPYKPERGAHHIIISGHITAETMQALINDLSRPDRRQKILDVVFVSPEEPTGDMKTYLKEVDTYVQYVQGSLLHAACLRKVKVNDAEAYLHVANRSSEDPARDDSTTLLTVASIKSSNPYLRCVIEVLQNNTKSQFSSIPGFLMKRGDAVICFQEIELALAAQNCLAPGCATLLSNLIRAPSEDIVIPDASQDMQDYLHGLHMELYSGPFSPFFSGMTFLQAAEFCYSKLDAVLIGTCSPLENVEEPGSVSGLLLCNPAAKISEECHGIFVARTAVHVYRVAWYCDACHGSLVDKTRCTPCGCQLGVKAKRSSTQTRQSPQRNIWGSSREEEEVTMTKFKPTKQCIGWETALMDKIRHDALAEALVHANESADHRKLTRKESVHANTKIYLDISRSFYWCESRPFDSILLDRGMALGYPFNNHILVLISCNPDDPSMDMRDFIVPMRSSRIPHHELKEIVLLGNAAYLEREWPQIRNLPLITVVDGDPLNRADLRAVSIKTATMCVVLSAWASTSIDPILDDKSAVITTLNLRAMPFDHPEPKDRDPHEQFELPIVTALQHDHNVRMLSEYVPETESTEAFLMEPFFTGQTVTISALSSLVSTSYFTPLAVAVLENLLYGFQSPLLESFLAEGVGLMGGDEYSPDRVSEQNIRIRLIPVKDGPWMALESIQTNKNMTYGALFPAALSFSMICLGISRKMQGSGDKPGTKRIVLTNPKKVSVLQWDDCVYVLAK